jgi:uncharacterized protein YbaP (TraB family)
MRVRKGLGLLAAALALTPATLPAQVPLAPAPAAPAASQPKPDPNDPDSVLVEELVVVARDRGPAWWTVSNGTSTVYVLGAPTLAPKRTSWDTTTLERRLQGAGQVILPFQTVKVKFGGSLGAAWNYMRLRSGGPFEETLDAAGRARFVAAREKIGEPSRRYQTHNALAAGLLLAGDYRDHSGLTNADTAKVVKVYAEKAHVRVVQRSYNLGPLLGQVIRTSPAAGRACLEAVLDQVEAGPGVTVTAAHAWAQGNTVGALDNERTYERCIAMVPGAAAFDARSKSDQAAAIEDALKTPGHSVAVVQLRPLLAQGGVLDLLRAKGYQIKTPGDL